MPFWPCVTGHSLQKGLRDTSVAQRTPSNSVLRETPMEEGCSLTPEVGGQWSWCGRFLLGNLSFKCLHGVTVLKPCC